MGQLTKSFTSMEKDICFLRTAINILALSGEAAFLASVVTSKIRN
jgi:hypothetical protein